MSRPVDADLMDRALTRSVPDADTDALARQIALTIATGGENGDDVARVCEALGGASTMYEWLGSVPGMPTLVAACLTVAHEVSIWSEDVHFAYRVESTRPNWSDSVAGRLNRHHEVTGMALTIAASEVAVHLAYGELADAAGLATALLDVLLMVWDGFQPSPARDEMVEIFKGQRRALVDSLEAAQREFAAAN